MNPQWILALSSLLFAGCAHTASLQCTDPQSDAYFFPPGALDSKDPDSDLFVRQWYSQHLRVMKEPSLACTKPGSYPVYRFTWLRTFHNPIAIRVGDSPEGPYLKAVELNGAGGYEPGMPAREVSRVLTHAEWIQAKNKFQLVLSSPPASDASSKQHGVEIIEINADGAQWIFEGSAGAGYQLVDVWSPDAGSSWELGLHMLRLTGLKVPDSERY